MTTNWITDANRCTGPAPRHARIDDWNRVTATITRCAFHLEDGRVIENVRPEMALRALRSKADKVSSVQCFNGDDDLLFHGNAHSALQALEQQGVYQKDRERLRAIELRRQIDEMAMAIAAPAPMIVPIDSPLLTVLAEANKQVAEVIGVPRKMLTLEEAKKITRSIEDANDRMMRRDREGAPWAPFASCPLVPRRSSLYQSQVLQRAMRVTHERFNNCGWPGQFLK